MSVLWTDEVKAELVQFVDELVELGVPKMEAYKRFCKAKGSKFKPSSAAVQYSRTKKDPYQIQRERYSEADDRLITLASYFAPQYGLKKRDVFRYLGDKLDRNFRAIEQRAYLLTRDLDDNEVPAQCPEDIAAFLQELLAGERQVPSPAPAKTVDPKETTALDTLGSLVKVIKELDQKDLSKSMAELATLQYKCEELEKKLVLTKDENKQLKGYLDELEHRLEQVKKQQAIVDYIVNEFASIRTIEQVGALKDFTNRFRTEVDKMGVVINRVDEWKEKYAEQLKEMYR